jgi:hypothetical protein
MNKKRLALAGILLAGVVATALVAREATWIDAITLYPSRHAFVDYPLPSGTTEELMDIGVADVNGDDVLDIFTSNHNSRQILWVGDGHGRFRDELSALGLDQDPTLPGVEISRSEPTITEPGVYVYWKARNKRSQFTLVVRTHRIKEIGRLEGTLRTYSAIHRYDGAGFTVQPPVSVPAVGSIMPETTLAFASEQDGALEVEIGSPGIPITVRLDSSIPLARVYVGQQKVSPRSRQFDLSFQDRHGLVWADYNSDGRMDVFISRGAVGGTLRILPPSVQSTIRDELLVSEPTGGYRDVSTDVGIEKRGCSGRKATWVDFNNDGLMDLFVNCQERGYVAGEYAKQLYEQKANKRFKDVAGEVGLDIPGHELIDFVWFDADNDGYIDLLTSEDTGFYLYRNHGGKSFTREFIGRSKFVRADNSQLKGETDIYWFVDGKLLVADFRGNGRFDVFSASKTGNTLLLNDGRGRFSMVDPGTIGLPTESVTASWADFDNDGLPDLYAVPQGLFRQRRDHTFEATGLLTLPARKYMAAIVNWADFDNDGQRDVLLALSENFSLWRWWEKLYKTAEDRFIWKLAAYRNVSNSSNHWLQVRLAGKPGNPQAIGARVTVQTADGQQTQQVGLNDGAFFSQGHYRLYFGLGSHARVDVMRIRWPDGQVDELRNVDGDRLQVIRQAGSESERAAK